MYDAPRNIPRPSALPLCIAIVMVAMALGIAMWTTVDAARARSESLLAPLPSLAECATSPLPGDHATPRSCYETVVAGLVSDDPAAGLAAIERHVRVDRKFARSCHMLLHPLGRTAGSDAVMSLDFGGKDCAAGFVHGYMEASLGDAGGLDAGLARRFCMQGTRPLQRADCEHGLGHVLMRNLDNDLPSALDRCARLGTHRFARNCAGGVFMENRFAATGRDGAAATPFHRADDPGFVCSRVPRAMHDTCQAWAVRDVPPGERIGYCRSLPAGTDEQTCLVAVGVRARPARDSSCRGEPACWYGIGFQGVARRGDDVRNEACTAAPAHLRSACALGAGFRLGVASDESGLVVVRRACRAFTGESNGACHRGFRRRSMPIDFM